MGRHLRREIQQGETFLDSSETLLPMEFGAIGNVIRQVAIVLLAQQFPRFGHTCRGHPLPIKKNLKIA